MRLYVARHAECIKNLIRIPGGPGSSLTSLGVHQARELAKRLATEEEKPSRISACPPLQTCETAAILAGPLNVCVQVREELRSINLGVLTGIPVEQARRLYPVSNASMDQWRAGQIELCDVKIEGMEEPLEFFRRGLRYLLNRPANDEIELVVATTSIMVVFDNMHRMHGPGRGEGYRVHEYGNAELLKLNFSAKHIEWLHLQAEKHAAS